MTTQSADLEMMGLMSIFGRLSKFKRLANLLNCTGSSICPRMRVSTHMLLTNVSWNKILPTIAIHFFLPRFVV